MNWSKEIAVCVLIAGGRYDQKTTANIILIIIAGTWAVLSWQNGYFMPLTADMLKICAALAGGSGAIAAAEKWGGKK